MTSLGRLEGQVRRLERLALDLLDASRLMDGKIELEIEEVDLAAVVEEVAGRFGDEAARSGSALLVEVKGPLVGRFDGLRVEQVAMGLIANAIKHGEGKPVEVRLCEHEGKACLSVRDRGIGIAPDDRARIFGRFERVASPRHFGGFGVGLWRARRIVEAHGGEIAFESRPGDGTTFTVTLPAAGRGCRADRPRLPDLPNLRADRPRLPDNLQIQAPVVRDGPTVEPGRHAIRRQR